MLRRIPQCHLTSVWSGVGLFKYKYLNQHPGTILLKGTRTIASTDETQKIH